MLSTIRRQLALDDLDLVSRHRGGSVAPAIANVSQHGGNLLVRKTAGAVEGAAMFPPDRVQEAGRQRHRDRRSSAGGIAADAIRRGDSCQGEFVVSRSLATLRSLELRASRAKLALPFARTT
jgi:hypothetical protein